MSGPFREPLPRLQGVQERCSPELPRMENPLASHPSTQLISGPAPRRSQDLPAQLSLEQGWPRGMQPSQLQGARRWEGLLLGSELCCHRFETLHDFCTRGPTLSSRTGPRSSAVSPAPTQVGAEQSGHGLTCWDPDHQESILLPTVGCKALLPRPAFEHVLSNFRCTGKGYFRYQDRFLAAKPKLQNPGAQSPYLKSSEARPRGGGGGA